MVLYPLHPHFDWEFARYCTSCAEVLVEFVLLLSGLTKCYPPPTCMFFSGPARPPPHGFPCGDFLRGCQLIFSLPIRPRFGRRSPHWIFSFFPLLMHVVSPRTPRCVLVQVFCVKGFWSFFIFTPVPFKSPRCVVLFPPPMLVVCVCL